MTLDRTYNNQASTVSSLGQGWNHSYDLELLNINEQDRLIDRKAVKDETGTIFLFEKVSNGAYASSMGKYITLKAESKKEHITVPAKNGNPQIDTNLESSYTMRTKDNLEYRFNEGGQLIYVTEPNKSFVFLQYDGKTGRLQKAITNQNLMTTFIYADGALEKANAYVQQGQEQVEELEKEGRGDGAQESENSGIDMDQVAIQPVSRGDVTSTVSEAVTNLALVRSVILPDGTGVDYEYDNQNQLTSVVRKSGEQKVTYQYEYDKKGNLSVIYDAKGNPYKLSYKEGKVSEVFYPEIHNDTESVKFTYREIQEGESVYETVIQRGINGSYGLEELVKSSLSGNTLYTKDENGVESTYTYEDNLLKTTNMKSEYQVIENGKVVTKEGVRTSNTTYDENLNMNPVLDIDEDHNETAYEYEEQSSDILDDLPTRVTDTSEGKHISDCEYTYDAYGNEIEELDHVTGDSVQCTYYGPESEFSGNLKREVEKTRVVSESGEVSYAVTTRDYQYTYQAATGVMEEKVVEVTGDKSVTSISRYDRMGNLVYEDDGLGNISSFTYDYLGRLTGASYSEGGILSEISRVYDANGTLIREVEKDGTVTVYTHDARNQMVKKVLSKGSMSRTYLTEYGFEWRDRENGKKELVSIVQNTSPEGQISKDYGNQLGWNIETVSNGLRVRIEYDKHGEAVLVRTGAADGTGKETVSMTLYDNAGNAWAQVVNPVSEGGEWLIGDETVVNQDTFDARGNRTSATDGMGNTMTYTYDELSRLTEVSAGKDSSKTKLMQYSYDIYEEDGTISSKSVDANGNVSKEYVDWEGNTVRNADQGNGKIQAIATGYQYDKKGNVIKETYTNGDYKAYEYDGRNRLVQVTWYKADGTGTLQTKYTYSTSDQVLTMEDFRVEGSAKNRYRYTAYEYDDMNQLTAQAEYDGSEIPTKDQIRERQTKYAYDKDGKLLEVTYSKTENGVVSLQYQYNEYGWLSKVKAKLDNRDSSTLREYLYNSDGKICEIRDYPEFAVNPSGHYMSKRYEFDDLMRVTHMEYRSSLQPDRIRESYDYAYDKNSNIISESIKNDWSIGAEGRANEVRTHTYDARGRLVFTEIQDRLKNESKIVTYTYDSVGNRLSEWDGATQTS